MYFVMTVAKGDYPTSTTPAWFSSYEDAHRCVMENWGDIWEYVYDYAVIVEIKETGLYPDFEEIQWFEWEYDEIHKDLKCTTIAKPEEIDYWGFTPIG